MIDEIQIVSGAMIFLVSFGSHMDILFIIKVKDFLSH